MPRRPRLIAPDLVGELTDPHLYYHVTGMWYFDNGPEDRWEDEEHYRADWEEFRDVILADWDYPGERPFSLWLLDYGLERVSCTGGPITPATALVWDWPAGIKSEGEMVAAELRAGRLTECVPGEAAMLERRGHGPRRPRP
jgi:hypothetical protein